MKLKIEAAHENISKKRELFQINSKSDFTNEAPLREELFSADQMAYFARKSAADHELSRTSMQGHLISRLADNEKILNAVRKVLSEAIKNDNIITPAGEWLIDNFYLIEEQIHTAKKHLPKGYSATLPQLLNASTPGTTRVYDIALQIISHSDGKIDEERLSSFIRSYQAVKQLTLGELWAIPIMLRLTLIENLRRVGALIAIDRVDQNLAGYWVKLMRDTFEKDPKNLILVIGDMVRSQPPIGSAFVSEMNRQLQGKGPTFTASLSWIEQRLNEDGHTTQELVNGEIQKQAVNQVSVSNSIGSLRLLTSIDWRNFVEEHSVVEQTLRKDGAGIYMHMDFITRDDYRHAVENIARQSGISEKEVAEIAVHLATENYRNEHPYKHTVHVGYFLIGKGKQQTRKKAGIQPSMAEVARQFLGRNRLTVYLASIFLITVVISALFWLKAYNDDTNNWLLLIIAILLLLSSSQLAISVVNFFSTLLVRPELLPRMDYSEIIPEESRTLVVIPALLTDARSAEDLVESLEVRFLANRNKRIHFGLLTDFTDAGKETLPGDNILLDLAIKGIEALKKKYETGREEIFYLFHRPRLWNASDKVWMGYERKRGKLSDLNGLLRGNAVDKFSYVIGDTKKLQSVKYVITLDADTQLPRGAAWKMIATMAHPLNHALYHEKKKRVTEGYGILQPRVTVSLPGPRSSFYSRLHGNEPGVDPYTRATSDVYQDLFREGSFIGKGIYDIDIFEKVLKDRFPENRILSHDLLEGCYVRSGLLSDVELFEKYPSSYQSDMKRRSRWTRGDWQIFSWFLPLVPSADKHLHRNPLSALSRWKIFDNIRRSLIPIALTLLIIMGWTVLKAPLFWTFAVTGIILFPIFVSLAWDAFRKDKNIILTHHIKLLLHNTHTIVVQTFFTVICLPYEAYVSFTAIIRTIWRMLISQKKLLQWDPSANYERLKANSLGTAYLSMWIAPLLTLIILAIQLFYAPFSLLSTGPIILLWVFSPFITWVSSRRMPRQKAVLTAEQSLFLQTLGRKTWAFFERFVTAEDNWLPPDNFQQYPVPVIAHRTSPTNIGLSMLAHLTAYDFGYLSAQELLERVARTIGTLKKMERFRGHFYNWYHTETLEPLMPKYVSTVDSGNFAGHVLTLRQGLFELLQARVIHPKIFEGISDTLRVFQETIGEYRKEMLSEFSSILQAASSYSHMEISVTVNDLQHLSESFEMACQKMDFEEGSIAEWWKDNLANQLAHVLDDIQILSPWFSLLPAPSKFEGLFSMGNNTSLVSLNIHINKLNAAMPALAVQEHTDAERQWLESFRSSLMISQSTIQARIGLIEQLGHDCIGLSDMDWKFLYNPSNHLLTIGYKVEDHICDPGYYDLLASEARLCVFVAIAQGKLPEDSWFALGRLLTNIEGSSILLSWSGSMFEYLMPLLVMPTYENTLLDQTYKAIIKRQINYAEQHGTPWGVSESACNMVDANSNYQYRAFGVPGLGLKRGLEADWVIAPYASVLSLMVSPEAACKNLEKLYDEDFEGDYGFYEAIDYTPGRLQRGQTFATVQSFMAHHEGMSFLSLAYLLLGQPMQRRFEAEPQFKATLLLLQERVPKVSSFYAHTTHMADFNPPTNGVQTRTMTTPHTAIPEVQLLSNGNYHIMLTNSGGGYSRWKDIAVTRWREDITCDNRGIFCYIRDTDTGMYWSTTFQPAATKGKNYEAAFSQGRVDFHNSEGEIDMHTEIVVSPEDDIEMRRIKITNRSNISRSLEITSYAEVVLATPASDAMQQAFSNLFVQTEILPDQQSVICSRRPRSAGEHPPWMFHSMAIQDAYKAETSYETDRMKFLGHGNTTARPKAMSTPGPLSNSQGSVLDPIVSIRHKIALAAEESISIDLIIGIAATRVACENLIEKYQDKHHKDRVFELAWTHSQVILRQINANEAEEQLFGKLAGSVIYTNPAFRAESSVITNNQRGQSGLWGYSISGDMPIVLLQIEDQSNIELVKQVIKAHTYWRLKGLFADLVIWNEDHDVYRQAFQTQIQALIPNDLADKPGGVFVRAADQISTEDRILFQTVARVVISDNKGTLENFLKDDTTGKNRMPRISNPESYTLINTPAVLPENLLFFNGSGGFSPDGRTYVIAVDNKNRTPVPWVNVIANAIFGTVISESGQAYTWMENAHEMRLTPWDNDTVSDTAGEIFYLRDEETGHFWSATPLPRGGESVYITTHGFGYSVFEHGEDGIHTEMSVYVDAELPVKYMTLKVRNNSKRPRRLSVTGYTEWVLGDLRAKTAMHIITETDPDTGAFFARNPYSTEFARHVAFFDTDESVENSTCDRTEFIGRNNSLRNPDAMLRTKLSGKIGVALDPCTAIQVHVELAIDEERKLIFRLGAGTDINNARDIVYKTRGAQAAHTALEKVNNYWKETTGALQIETPDTAVNIITNGWLTYQTLSCRLWGRSGYYQSGGAFGFRDQLQDVLSLLHARPELARQQILLAASRQFEEGDVQHWWHPPNGRGVRTRISDDYLWLPYATCRYLVHTGDTHILDASVFFLKGKPLNADEESYYDLPAISPQSAPLYEHCVRAIKHGLHFGTHGLPLMGTGDWNDGMDKVGAGGKGESIWLAFFLYDILMRFSQVAHRHNDPDFAIRCRKEADRLRVAIDENGWDGEWYRRAYFDDGTPLGSAGNTDCQIDSIAQSWSVLSGGGDAARAGIAMEAVRKRLVKKDTAIIQLLDPPFDKGEADPGYIKGYLPGIRENGGQYTHAAVWMAMAFAALGNNRRTWELLRLINPINHGDTSERIAVYKVEPYVMTGDIYALPPHSGRGGWTWYTGSAGWMYQLIIESFAGINRESNKLRFKPCLPPEWNEIQIRYRHLETMYNITIQQKNAPGEIRVTENDVLQEDGMVTLVDDKSHHEIKVICYNNSC